MFKVILPKMNKDLTSIIVPNLKLDLLESFLRTNIEYFDNKTELIIVTSALNEKSVWDYRSKFPKIKFIPIEENKGFANTVNIGFKASTGKFVGTCNDDVILTKNWISYLLESTDEMTGSINPIILNLDKSVESAGIKIDLKGKAFPLQKAPSNKIVDATNAACVIYSREALKKVGVFDERFGSYLEDIDLSLRLSKAGYQNIVNSRVKVIHLQHQTSGTINFNKSYYDFKNWILIILKNWTFEQIIKNLPQILLERAKNFSGMLKQIY
ncbi:MAG: glycosyltransferase [Pseudomonadales bacterium]|nr:glycosyltransferase [Pseudomonadales bacterium]